MTHSESLKEFAAGMAKAQAVMKGAPRDHSNPAFPRSRYADLASVWDACREALTSNGFAVLQMPSAAGNAVTITTMLMHSSGEWMSEPLTMTAKDAGPQSIGSAITYGRRYGLMSSVGICPEDDDGEAATDHRAQSAEANRPQAQRAQATPQRSQAAAPKRDNRPYHEFATSGVQATNATFKEEQPGAADIVNLFQLNRHMVRLAVEMDLMTAPGKAAKASDLAKELTLLYQTAEGRPWVRRELPGYLAANLKEARGKAALEAASEGEVMDDAGAESDEFVEALEPDAGEQG